jgi:hypothetical protein
MLPSTMVQDFCQATHGIAAIPSQAIVKDLNYSTTGTLLLTFTENAEIHKRLK